ncbi:MAG: aminomethyl-transferring glycine dehydrogenase subunit GcvPB [Planctomycetota bacterium]|nr:aminomethyl-transferring glycine dehydrogenase subunit GcvPB [Planctomycetota bacterium]MDA1179270.1 aminomethyl-transferring glycine dehydrogenase subunit GcvPB [Planctomycetota bacterium]
MRNQQAVQLLSELSQPGRRASTWPDCDVPMPASSSLLPRSCLAEHPPQLPELSEPDVVRHFSNLSTRNMSVDTHMYPLGSCTMKYNPKRHERWAALPGFAHVHPLQSDDTMQGLLQILFELQQMLGEISGLPAVSLQPAAGAQGELAALLVAAAYLADRGEKRHKVLVPDSAHGTNPASARMAGFSTVTVPSTSQGFVDLDQLHRQLDQDVAVVMITNPNTLGLFDPQIQTVSRMVHDVGGLIYLDGANMNAIVGVSRPGDFGADMMHFNPHKTFSGPHGGGGPGAGPICVTHALEPYLPSPVVEYDPSGYRLNFDRPHSVGRVRSFLGNVGVLLRAYAYLRTLGPEGLRRTTEQAVLNANYLLQAISPLLPVPHGPRCMHEFVATAKVIKQERGISAMDIAKRLLDYGFHAPTVYFPLTVPESIMIEPTETESKETLDAFVKVLAKVLQEPDDLLHEAPHSTEISRPDEVRAARNPTVRWQTTPTGNNG